MRQDASEEVSGRIGAVDAVGFARVELQIIGQICIDQLLNELDRILNVDVVIPRALNQQQTSLEVAALFTTESSR